MESLELLPKHLKRGKPSVTLSISTETTGWSWSTFVVRALNHLLPLPGSHSLFGKEEARISIDPVARGRG
jgi:hypothetical protein